MTIKRCRFLLTTSVALIGLTMATAVADERNKETVFQFSAPVEVPGKVLPVGKYIFKLADSESDRHIVEIFSEDEHGRQHFITTILVIPDYRTETPDKTMMQFEERAANSPQAIKSWFYPGDNAGWRFTYPKSEEVRPLKPIEEPALAEAKETEPAPPVALPEPAPVETASAPPEVVEEEVLVAELAPVPVTAADDASGDADRTLPDTAGNSIAFLLAGVTMVGAGLATLGLSRPVADVKKSR